MSTPYEIPGTGKFEVSKVVHHLRNFKLTGAGQRCTVQPFFPFVESVSKWFPATKKKGLTRSKSCSSIPILLAMMDVNGHVRWHLARQFDILKVKRCKPLV